jgi:hypothetical protein
MKSFEFGAMVLAAIILIVFTGGYVVYLFSGDLDWYPIIGGGIGVIGLGGALVYYFRSLLK